MARLVGWLVTVLCVVLKGSQSVDKPLPAVPDDFYSSYVEGVFMTAEHERQETTTVGVSLMWNAYDNELQLLRQDSFDVDGNSLGPTAISHIEDQSIGVVYIINKYLQQCVIRSLQEDTTNQSSYGGLHIKTLPEALLLSTLNFTYSGSRVIRAALVDTWSSHNFSNSDVTGADVTVAFTKPGTFVKNINSMIDEPILWQFSISGNYSSKSFSSVLNFYDLSYDRPSLDVFDTSMCSTSENYEFLIILLPGALREVNVDHLRSSIRLAVANYTGVYPLQIGNIQIISDNGTFIFASLHVSNLTSLAKVDKRVSAHDAVQLILSNLSDRRLPFAVELMPNVHVFPILYAHSLNGAISKMMASILSTTPLSSAQLHSTSVSMGLSQTSNVVAPSLTSYTVITSLNKAPSSFKATSVLSLSRSSTLLQSNTVTLTVTKTVLYSSYLPQTAGLIPTVQPYVTKSPSSGKSDLCAHALSTGETVGIAVGAFIAGIFTTILVLVLCVACCNWCNQQTMKSAGWQPISRTTDSVDKEMDYFH